MKSYLHIAMFCFFVFYGLTANASGLDVFNQANRTLDQANRTLNQANNTQKVINDFSDSEKHMTEHEFACSKEKSLNSKTDSRHATMDFQNESGQTRKIYWLDYHGRRVLYKVLKERESFYITTYFTHPWVITDSLGKCLEIHIPNNMNNRIEINLIPK